MYAYADKWLHVKLAKSEKAVNYTNVSFLVLILSSSCIRWYNTRWKDTDYPCTFFATYYVSIVISIQKYLKD